MDAGLLFTDYSFTNFPTYLFDQCDARTLIVSNISNTLFKPFNTMCGRKWRQYVSSLVYEAISDTESAKCVAAAIEKYLTIWFPRVKVYDETSAVFKKLQGKQHPVVAITKKKFSESGLNAYDILKSLKIDLFHSYEPLGKMRVVNNTAHAYADVKMEFSQYTFFKCIIFTNGKYMDLAINHFVKNLYKKPKHIIVLQNSMTHKDEFKRMAEDLKIPVTYLTQLKEKKVFDSVIGTIQFIECMKGGKTLTDEEALKLKNESVDYRSLLIKQIKDSAYFFKIRD